MTVTVRIPTQLRELTGGQSEVAVHEGTITAVLAELGTTCPGLLDRICDEHGALRRFVNVFVADEDIRFLQGPATDVRAGQTVSIVPAVAGG